MEFRGTRDARGQLRLVDGIRKKVRTHNCGTWASLRLARDFPVPDRWRPRGRPTSDGVSWTSSGVVFALVICGLTGPLNKQAPGTLVPDAARDPPLCAESMLRLLLLGLLCEFLGQSRAHVALELRRGRLLRGGLHAWVTSPSLPGLAPRGRSVVRR